jgi:putative addiction module component (TIGR02574 family)
MYVGLGALAPQPNGFDTITADLPTLTTARLVLRPLELSDAPAVQAIFPQWEVIEFMSTKVPWPYPADGAETFIRDFALPAMEAGTQWHWSIRPRSNPGPLISVIARLEGPETNRGFCKRIRHNSSHCVRIAPMNQHIKSLYDEAQKLTAVEREELAEMLLQSLEPAPGNEMAWAEEADRRWQSHMSTGGKAIDAFAAIDGVREHIKRRT